MSAAAEKPKTNRERLSAMEKKIDDIHEALIGTQYNPQSGVIPRLQKVETYVESHKKRVWMLTGIVAVLGTGASYAKEIIHAVFQK